MTQHRYHSIAIILHWLMAGAFILMFSSGLLMVYSDLPARFRFDLYQWHKALGILLLLAVCLRLAWRLFKPAPALPAAFTPLERKAAKIGHWGLYALMIVLPFSGWVMVSSSSYDLPTSIFGWFEWPHLPGLADNETLENLAKNAHWLLAIVFGLLIALHVAAVIKHTFFDKQAILKRMWWTRADEK
jgi:cytochrome b561